MPSLQFLYEAFRFSYQALQANKVRTLLTALGLLIGNASVILVVTISITSRDLILDKIRGIGSNLISAYYDAGTQDTAKADADFIKLADVEAVRKELGSRVVAASAVINAVDRLVIDGHERDVRVIGTDEFYAEVRNLQLVTGNGRFFDPSDIALRQKVAMLDNKLAITLFGSISNSVGQIIKIHGLQFTIIGVFRERTSTFGQSELGDNGAALIPFTVQRFFEPVERVDPMYLQVRVAEDVPAATQVTAEVLSSRHRQGARYTVQNLTAILETASTVATVLTLVLVLVSAIALLISGIGIMNIMLVTVTERTREIGVRMSLGASRRAVLLQFLLEAILISVGGGLLGILAGVAVPLAANLLQDEVYIPISVLSIVVAFGVSFVVGIVFGILPANRASRLNPTEALRYE
ncbi:ABC transporter permease [uncultured Paludibaculum sp.]|uniref:ABC transporter permease n=1 Tax=uncultured Paludibaculum sp. TaxID=1765020 RepID=UPI002AAB659A|nr:ABC transporter permease [uncultured Paludibaculum sp.]